jgi:two-component system cell cycle response regulator DivK
MNESVIKRAPIDPKDAHILVVEDNVSNFVLIARLLAFMGVQKCEWKTTGWGVVDFANTMPRVDLVLMDLRLPHEDGYDALRQIRADERLKNTLVVVVTAHGSSAEMQRAKEAGFDGFLSKPLDADRFPEQIRQILSGKPIWDLGI